MSTMQATPAASVATPKRLSIVKSIEAQGTTLIMKFMNDAERRLDFSKLSDDLRLKCAMHGLEQKFRDNFAGVAKDAAETGANAIDLAVSYTDELIKQLFDENKWTATRAPGEARETPIDVLAQAIVAVAASAGKTVTVEAVTSMLEKKSKEERGALSRKPDVKEQIAKIRASKAAPESKLDLESLGL